MHRQTREHEDHTEDNGTEDERVRNRDQQMKPEWIQRQQATL
jgi:hypothetical protein